MDENLCRELLANLQLEQNRKTTLSEIKKTLISGTSSTSVASNFLKAPELFNCLEDGNSEQTLLACDILSLCMGNLSIGDGTNELKDVIEKSLSHSNPNVQAFGLREFRRILVGSTASESFINETIILLVIKCLASDETSVGTPSIDVLVQILPKFLHMRSIQANLDDLLRFATILVPGFMRFYGSIAVIHPAKIYEGYPKIIGMLFDCLLSEDLSMAPVAYDTLGCISYPSEGKRQLHYKHGAQLKATFKHFNTVIRNLPNEPKLRLLSCLQLVFSCDPATVDNQITSITQTWYGYLSEEESLNLVMDYIRNPFPDIKRAALALLKAIIGHRWGQQYLLNTGGFIEYLLDRKREADKDIILDKYEIIRLLAQSNVFDEQTQAELKRYVSEGAFFVQGITEVAIEGSS
ncbi:LOW QUALITY PROTEIN: 26S proteasome non-ATPase regulatory subunit 5 [Uranotaenia lowii]|uniref:LOW QUALITY PROTEIN: 26S proteasome non-ATPase regulatory subunit 5 n=1 Tax=Uranotaenia lowii TaxID=190385 RepID=UPI00247B1DDF|nr:LOW QUALITY PROTEIN: 26S proteasome non-ATPase regulatory subunit 5 [Uranotaenia lowii]